MSARWIPVIVLALVLVLVGVLATRPAADSKVTPSALVGRAAPSVKGNALDGQPVDIATLRGRYVVLNFFATWCQPCRVEHPELLEFARTNSGPTDPTVVAVAYDRNDVNATRSFFAQNGGDWPVVVDEKGHISVSYGVRGLPETFVIDPEGVIVSHTSGGITLQDLNRLTTKVS